MNEAMLRPMRHGALWLAAAALGVIPAWASAPEAVPPKPKVEYSRVEGKDCLQPAVRGSDVTPQDYLDAEQRWVNAAYPGAHIPGYESILTLVPPSAADPVGMQRVVHTTDTVTVVTGPRQTVRVCFDVNVTELQPLVPDTDEDLEVY